MANSLFHIILSNVQKLTGPHQGVIFTFKMSENTIRAVINAKYDGYKIILKVTTVISELNYFVFMWYSYSIATKFNMTMMKKHHKK